MKISLYPKAFAFALAGLLAGCQHGEEAGCRPDPASGAPVVPLHLERLETPFFQIKNPAQGLHFMQAHPAFARYYLQAAQAPADTMAKVMMQLATNPDLQKLGRETETAFADSAGLRQDIGAMFGRIKYYFPKFNTPPVTATFVSGLKGDKGIYATDSLVVLSLDWFIGPKASYRPQLPQYMLRRYQPADVLPTLATTVAGKYIMRAQKAPSVLDEMIRQGKRLYFAGQVLPCAPDSLLMGYTRKEFNGLKFNEAKVWGHFLEKDILYATTPFLIQKYVAERPNVPEIDATCPGRVGQWVGLQIIRKYMAEHTDVTLAQLMAEKDSQRILNESHYRPKKQ